MWLLAKAMFYSSPGKRQFNYTHSICEGLCRVHLADWKQNSIRPTKPFEHYVAKTSCLMIIWYTTLYLQDQRTYHKKDSILLFLWISLLMQKAKETRDTNSQHLTMEYDSPQVLSCLKQNRKSAVFILGSTENLNFPCTELWLPMWFWNELCFLLLLANLNVFVNFVS